MAQTMRAARFYGNRDIRVDSVPIPTLKPGKAIVEIAWSGICGSDLHEYLEGPKGVPLPEKPHPITGEVIPTILGHEFCGTISSVNPSSKFSVGQKVMVDPRLNCKSCSRCSSHNDHQCAIFGFLGYSGFGGGFSEFCSVEESMLYAMPENVDLEFAALIEPLTVGVHAVKMVDQDGVKGKNVLVVGGGPVGYAVVLALKAAGVGKLVLSEPTRKRQEQTGQLVDLLVDPIKENVGEKCRELTGGVGVDIAFDCAGVQKGIEAACDALKYSGWWVNVSLWEKNPVLPFWAFMAKELRLTSSFCYNAQDFADTMQMIGEGKFAGYEHMVTGRIGLEDVVEKGFKELTENKDHHVKILVSPKKS